jgi:hypothetical protein
MFEIVNAKGAAKRLGCSVTWIHKLVSAGKLKAYIYDEKGTLIIRPPEEKRQGRGLYFFVSDLDAFQEKRSKHTPSPGQQYAPSDRPDRKRR